MADLPAPALHLPDAGAPRAHWQGGSVAMVTAGVMLATLIQGLDMTISNVALPYMAGTFAVSYDKATWVLTSYIIAAAIMTPPTGWLAAKFGRHRLFLAAILGFIGASVLCGLCQSLPEAIGARVVQGIMGAALTPLSQATLLDTYPRERHPQAMAIWGMGIMLGPILGPTLGGWLTDQWSWRWVYYINVPVGGMAALLVAAYVRDGVKRAAPRFDGVGFLCLSLAIAGLQIVLDRGETDDWFSSPVIVTAALASGLGFYLFLVQSFLVKAPFVRPDLFADKQFGVGLVLNAVVAVVLMGSMALFPPLLQGLLNFPVTTVGLLLAPRGIGTMAAMMLVGQIAGRVPGRVLMLGGMLLAALAMAEMSGFSLRIGPWEVFVCGLLQGFGLGFVFPVLVSASFSTLPEARRVEAAGIYNLVRNMGASIGISIMTALVDRNTQINHAILGGMLTPFTRQLSQPALALYAPNTARGLALLNEEVTRQAAMIGYIDDFRLMMGLTLLAAPLTLLIQGTPQTREQP